MEKMSLVGLILSLFFLVNGIESKQDIKFFLEDVLISEIDPNYFDVEITNTEIVWYNDSLSGLAVNFSLIKEFPRDAETHFDMYLKRNGEYKTHSGISVNIPWCQAVTDPILMMSFTEALGMPQETCPAPVGVYSTDFWSPSTKLMPGDFPGMDYKVVFEILVKKKPIFSVWLWLVISSY